MGSIEHRPIHPNARMIDATPFSNMLYFHPEPWRPLAWIVENQPSPACSEPTHAELRFDWLDPPFGDTGIFNATHLSAWFSARSLSPGIGFVRRKRASFGEPSPRDRVESSTSSPKVRMYGNARLGEMKPGKSPNSFRECDLTTAPASDTLILPFDEGCCADGAEAPAELPGSTSSLTSRASEAPEPRGKSRCGCDLVRE